MGYYRAGDFYRGGAGYYRGYYAAGGLGSFLKKAGNLAGKIIQSPVGGLVTSAIPGAKYAVALGQMIGSHKNAATQAAAVQAGPMSAVAKSVAAGGGALPPSMASAPGHHVQATTSGGMMVSHQPIPTGNPGANAATGGAMPGGRSSGPRRARRRDRRGGRHTAPRRYRSHAWTNRRPKGRTRRRYARGDYYAGGDSRMPNGEFAGGSGKSRRRGSAGGGPMPYPHHGHTHRRKRRRGRVSFVTRDGRRVSF
jgi:hypothetical protein